MKAGEAIYADSCSACHHAGGAGVARWFPTLKGHPDVQSRDATNLVRVILAGARTAPTPTAPTPLAMPSYAWKLSDEEIADVATYVRNAWGNQASEVSPGQVKRLRAKLNPQEARVMR
jgi:mono/diheme cytochrome c family protein